jgi:hypothetical protein
MKTTRYRFEQAVQAVTEDTTQWLKDEFKSILESDKDFTRKADYIGFSIASIDAKVASLDEEIKELQNLKKSLKSAKTIALTTGAQVFAEYGVDKLEGAGISSITVTKAVEKSNSKLEILDEEAIIRAGYYTKIVDEDALIKALQYKHRRELIPQTAYKLTLVDTSTPAKLKINKRRGAKGTIQELIA